jgi:N-acetylglucosamine kinase-like BadF-type ATPase
LYYFGIDGGGTHSRIALVNPEGEELARFEAGSTNIYSVNKEAVFENLSALLDGVFEKAGLGKTDLAGGCIGSAGLAREDERALFRSFFDRLVSPSFPVKLCTDGEILLCGGLEASEGYCLIAGTGSIALGRAADGRLVRSGGFGHLLGDEGGAAWIGQKAVSRLLRSLEDRDLPTGMADDVVGFCKCSSPQDLIRYVHHEAGKAEIAALAPLVTEAAQRGDPLALDILHGAAAELSLLVKSAVTRSPWINNPVLVLAGGVIEHDEIVRRKVTELITKEFPGFTLQRPRKSALEGACFLALT